MLLVLVFFAAVSLYGCNNEPEIQTGNFQLYKDGEAIGTANKLIIHDDIVCVVNRDSSDDWFDYYCWDKEGIEYIEIE
jgi:hypothetical protein